MSIFRRNDKGQVAGFRCDWCGKIANNQNGEYERPVVNASGYHLAGYIRQPDWDKESRYDICEECAANCCPFCGSDKIVRVTPPAPGPYGCGRCKDCEKRWVMPVD